MYILLDFDVLKLAKVWAWNIYIYSVNILYWKYLQVPAAVPAKAAAFKAEIKKRMKWLIPSCGRSIFLSC